MSDPEESQEHKQSLQTNPTSRNLKGRRALQLLGLRKGRVLFVLIIVVVLFGGMASIQHWFVREQLKNTTKQQLRAWAGDVAKEIVVKNTWDMEGYRRASVTVPAWCVVATNGLVIDIEGFIPGLFGAVEMPDESVYRAPKTVITSVGEKWRLFARKVVGGVVIVGICSPENDAEADAKLLFNISRLGSTITEAESARSREIDFIVDYAVIGSAGELKADWGGVPLKTDANSLPPANDDLTSLSCAGKPYVFYCQPVLDMAGGRVGAVMVSKDTTLETKALALQDRFNFRVIAGATVILCGVFLWLVVQERLTQTRNVTLAEALKSGETGRIEFKSTFQWDLRRDQYVEERRLDTLKSIAGFLNAKGGTLFIGVSEDAGVPALRGLDEDLKYVGGSKDKLQRTLRDLITTRIGPEFSPLIADNLEEEAGQQYWMVAVEDSPEPAFVRWKLAGEAKEQKRFYVREGPKTTDLDNESTWHYIKNKWG